MGVKALISFGMKQLDSRGILLPKSLDSGRSFVVGLVERSQMFVPKLDLGFP